MCIEDDYMNFYYHGVHDVIYDIVPANWPETNGLTFYRCEILGARTGSFNNPTEIFHKPDITYKTRLIMIKEGDIPIPIGD